MTRLTSTTAPIVRDRIYINGAWVASHGRETIAVTDSNTEERLLAR